MHSLDYLIVVAYFGLVIYIGIRAKRAVHSSDDFFLSGRSLHSMTTGLAFMAANLGSFELMGGVANGAKYGMVTSQLYWIGSIPAMIFSGLIVVRFFYRSKARSVPEYLRLRFDEKTRALNAVSFAILTIFTSGLNLYGLAVVFHALFHWPIAPCIWISAITVLTYVVMGGLRASIYTEVVQLFLMILGILPLTILVIREFGGLSSFIGRLPPNMTHAWLAILHPEGTAYGGGLFSIVVCMGVASCAYWSTDFLVVQRAMAAKDLESAQKTPLIATFPRMFFPFLTVIPGLAALLVIPHELQGNYSLALPLMFLHYYPAGWLGLGITALLASFMSGMAGNITAFNTVWTYGLYQSYIMPNRSDHHYLVVGRIVTVVGTVVSIAAAYSAIGFRNIFDYWALVSTTFVGAPFATFLLGVFTRRLNGTAAFIGMLVGVLASVFHYVLYRLGYLSYGSDLAMGFYGGFYGFLANLVVALVGSQFESPRPPEELRGLVYAGALDLMSETEPWYRKPLALAVIAAVLVIFLNYRFW